jgi:hypothetical protein
MPRIAFRPAFPAGFWLSRQNQVGSKFQQTVCGDAMSVLLRNFAVNAFRALINALRRLYVRARLYHQPSLLTCPQAKHAAAGFASSSPSIESAGVNVAKRKVAPKHEFSWKMPMGTGGNTQ